MSDDKNKWERMAKEAEQQAAEMEQSPEEGEQPVESEKIEFPKREKLEDELNAMDLKMAEYKNEAMRLHADMENLRRRTEREVSNARKFGAEKLIQDMLPVIDSIERGLTSVPADAQMQSVTEGMQLTLDLLEKTLEKHGVTVINPGKGEPFNPDMHEAMAMQPDPEAQSNTILQVMQKGYALNGRVLRAAMVMVAQ